MWTKYIPRFTHGGWFGGFAPGDLWDYDPEADIKSRWNRHGGDDFVNASGKTDYQEDYEWAQHQASWAEYVKWKRDQAIQKAKAKGLDPKMSYSVSKKTLTLTVETSPGVFEEIWSMPASDAVREGSGCMQSVYGPYHILEVVDVVARFGKDSEEFRLYGYYYVATDAYFGEGNNYVHGNPRDLDDSDPLATTCGCIRVSNEGMEVIWDTYNYYYEQGYTDWTIEWVP